MREEWQAAHGEESSPEDPTESIPEEVWEEAVLAEPEEPEEPAEPEYEPYQSKAASYVVISNFSAPKPWDPANPDFKMGLIADHLWRSELGFANGVNIAFKILDPATGTQYGGQGLDPARIPATGTAVVGGPPIVLAGPLNGKYKLSFNENELRYRFERAAESDYVRLSVMGDFNNWNPNADLMTMTEDHTWEAEIAFDGREGAEFVFIADGLLENQWGDDQQSGGAIPASGTSTLMGEPVRLAGPLSGPHRFTFNELTGEYRVEPMSEAEANPLPAVPAPQPVLDIPRLKASVEP
jgi:hypothetical protein